MTQELGPNQKAWIAALRSGEYRQAQEQLCRAHADGSLGFCCLGVAKVIATGVVPDEEPDWAWYAHVDEYAHFALRDDMGSAADDSGRHRALFELNDGADGVRAHTFAEIADILEAHPKQYFTGPK